MWIAFILLAVATSASHAFTIPFFDITVPFTYESMDVTDPANIKYVKESLKKMNNKMEDGITLLNYQRRDSLFKIKYKATFLDKSGRKCTMSWYEGSGDEEPYLFVWKGWDKEPHCVETPTPEPPEDAEASRVRYY